MISQFSWGPSGQLGYDLAVAHARLSRGKLASDPHGGAVSAFMVLNTAAPGSNLLAASRMIGDTPQTDLQAMRELNGVLSPSGLIAYVQQSGSGAVQLEAPVSGRLAEVSMVTGQITQVLLSGNTAALGDPMSMADGGRYLLFPVRVPGSRSRV